MELTSIARIYSPAEHAHAAPPRPQAALASGFLLNVLDAIDYGVLLVDEHCTLHHANRSATAQLRRGEMLRVVDQRVALRDAAATAQLTTAVDQAVGRGMRSTLHLSPDKAVAVVPASAWSPTCTAMAALVLSRPRLCTPLALDAFSREHGLTSAECTVLHALAGGETPERIAQAHGVALCTVRTQVLSIRQKTGTLSMRDLLVRLARVPPLMGVLAD